MIVNGSIPSLISASSIFVCFPHNFPGDSVLTFKMWIPAYFILLTPSVLGRIFVFILLAIWQFHRAAETDVGIKIVKTLGINLTSIDLS